MKELEIEVQLTVGESLIDDIQRKGVMLEEIEVKKFESLHKGRIWLKTVGLEQSVRLLKDKRNVFSKILTEIWSFDCLDHTFYCKMYYLVGDTQFKVPPGKKEKDLQYVPWFWCLYQSEYTLIHYLHDLFAFCTVRRFLIKVNKQVE